MDGQQGFGIIEGQIHAALRGGLGPLVAGDLVFLAVGRSHHQPGVLHLAAGHGELLQVRVGPGGTGLLQQTAGGALLRRGAADPLEGQLLQK